MTDEEWQRLHSNFNTTDLLEAVDAVDSLRDHLNDGEDCRPPELRTNLLKLHRLAMLVVNNAEHGKMDEMFDLAMDLEEQVSSMMTYLEQVQSTLEKLVALMPENEDDAD
jgi:hypothetical protein